MSTATGKWAEEVAATWLANAGFEIVARNWKTRWCEIDIVAKKNNRIHFVEVKYRKNARSGSGLDYITHHKAKRMEFAALQWASEHEWEGDCMLDVIAVEGEANPKVTYILNAIGF